MSYESNKDDWKSSRALQELIIVAAASFVLVVLASVFGVFEAIVEWTQAYERGMLDEFIVVSAVLVSALSVFSFLRWRELVREAAAHERTDESLQERADQLALVNKVVEQMAAGPELDGVLDETVRLVQESFGYHHVALFIADQEQDELLMKARAGDFVHLLPSDHRLKLDQGMIGWAYTHGKTLLANNVEAEPHYVNLFPGLIPTRSELSVPIQVGGKCVGVLDAQSPHRNDFEENDVMVLETLACQFAMTIENARLYETIEQGITERRRSDQALGESERRFRSIAETASDAIIIFDKDEIIFFWNPAAKAIFGYEAGETRGKLLDSIITRQFSGALREEIERVVSAREMDQIEKIIEAVGIRKNGTEFPLELSLATWRTQERVFFTIIARDITERKQAEKALEQKAQELARSNAELEQFAYVASHDLQEPLRMIRSYLQLLERRYKEQLDSDANEFIWFAVDGATRMQTLINDLLAYSRVTTRARPFEPADCSTILDFVLTDLKVAIEESDAVVTHDPLPTIIADETQLKQLFQNLVGNGLKFHQEGARPEIHVGAERQGNWWTFSVHDNGIGIDHKYFEHVFAIFQRLHSRDEYPGTGIGLAVCKKIVERHGGRIWVESEPGQGSTFYFTIPDREESAA